MFCNISEIYGALPYLGAIWTLAPVFVFLVTLAIDYGIINALMDFEEFIKPPEVPRVKYVSFRFNDTVLIPPFLALCALVMHSNPDPQGWYLEQWWHLTALFVSFAISIWLEVTSVKTGVFTWRQEISPSKLWHTIIFGVMGYWMLTGLVAAWANSMDQSLVLIIIICQLYIWVFVLWAEQVQLRHDKRKTPVNAHPVLFGDEGIISWPDDPR